MTTSIHASEIVSADEVLATPGHPLDMNGLSFLLFGHAAFQYLNAACELNLIDLLLERDAMTAEEIRGSLHLAERAGDILLLGCTALGLLRKENGRYLVADLIRRLAAEGTWSRIKDTVAFEQHIVYEAQADFVESLRQNTNIGLRRIPGDSPDLYHRLSQNPRLESVFYRYMRSWSELANQHLAAAVDLNGAMRVLDCGGGDAVNAIMLAQRNPELHVTVLEIPASVDLSKQKIAEARMCDRVAVHPCDMFTDTFPSDYDCVLFAHQLVIWTPEENTALLRKAFDALKPGGRVVIFSSISNDEGDGPMIAALDSVYFAAIPAEGGMIYPWRLYERCLRESGFTSIERQQTNGWTPHGIIVATKPNL